LRLESLFDGILVTSGEGRENKLSSVWMPWVHRKTGALDNRIHNREHVGEVKIRCKALRVAIQSHSDKIDIPGTFTVTKDCAFDSVGASEDTQLGSCNSTS